MSFGVAQSIGLTFVGAAPAPYALVERWYEADTCDSIRETASPERRLLRVKAEEAVGRARSVATDGRAIDDRESVEYELPPMVVERRVKVRFRRVDPLPPPTLDGDDLPL